MEYDFYKSNNKYFTTMKKTLFYLAALVCCIATGMAFTSCGDDEPDVTANATYSITFGETSLTLSMVWLSTIKITAKSSLRPSTQALRGKRV